MRRPVRRRKLQGFTLIEMALVVIVLGVVITLIAPPIFTMIKRKKIEAGKDGLNTIKNQIVGYAMTERELPATLSMAGDTTDVWRRDVEYFPAQCLVDLSCAGIGDDLCDAVETDLDVDDTPGTVENVAFLIASRGHRTSAAADYDYSTDPVDIARDGEVDDLVQYMTLHELKALVCVEDSQEAGGDDADKYLQTTQWPETNLDKFIYGQNSDTAGFEGVSAYDDLTDSYVTLDGSSIVTYGAPWTIKAQTTFGDNLDGFVAPDRSEQSIRLNDSSYAATADFTWTSSGFKPFTLECRYETDLNRYELDWTVGGNTLHQVMNTVHPAATYIANFYLLSKTTGADQLVKLKDIKVYNDHSTEPDDRNPYLDRLCAISSGQTEDAFFADACANATNACCADNAQGPRVFFVSQRGNATRYLRLEGEVALEYPPAQARASEFGLASVLFLNDVRAQ